MSCSSAKAPTGRATSTPPTHRDGDPFHNTRENLTWATPAQQMANRQAHRKQQIWPYSIWTPPDDLPF